jgi:hypothetical protein
VTARSVGTRLALLVAGLAAVVVVAAGNGVAGGTQASAKGPGIPGASKGNAPGIGRTISIALLLHLKDCGTIKAPTNIAGTEERYNTYVKWFNEHVRFPGGRKLAIEFLDSGGADPTCADVQRASILKAIKEDKVFAIIGPDGGPNPGLNAADIIAKNHVVNLASGSQFHLLHDLKTHQPYVWNLGEPGEIAFQNLTAFIQKRVKSTQYTADNGSKRPRVWGMLFLDNTLNKALANAVRKQMAGIGITAKQYFISPSIPTAAQQASGIALQMQHDGVNSLIYGFQSNAFLSFNTAASNAGYHPDFYINGYTSLPQLAVFVPLFGKEFIKRLYGVGPPMIEQERVEIDPNGDITPTSCPSCYGQVNNLQVAYTEAYVQAGGKDGRHPEIGANAVPALVWPSLATLATGIANAGSVLNAQTFAWGLQHGPMASCMTKKFYGVQPYAQAPIYGYDKPVRSYLYSGFTTLYFDPNAKTKFGSTGMFQSYDNYERFDSAKDLPANPTYDTGEKGGYKLIRQQSHINVNYDCTKQAAGAKK